MHMYKSAAHEHPWNTLGCSCGPCQVRLELNKSKNNHNKTFGLIKSKKKKTEKQQESPRTGKEPRPPWRSPRLRPPDPSVRTSVPAADAPPFPLFLVCPIPPLFPGCPNELFFYSTCKSFPCSLTHSGFLFVFTGEGVTQPE